MRSEEEMYALILCVAAEDARVRAVLLNGSRADPNAVRDGLQDYDVVYVVTETAPFLSAPEWIAVFGERAIMQQPDALDAAVGKTVDFSNSFAYLMQFRDGNRIDLTLRTMPYAYEQARQDSLTRVLLDKDGMFRGLPAPSDESYWIRRPSQAEYDLAANEFWWVVLYVAKGIRRENLSYAQDALNAWVRPQALKMLTWQAGFACGFRASAGKSGKNLPHLLPHGMWGRYLATFCPAQRQEMCRALHTLCALFEESARSVAQSGGFCYPQADAQGSYAHLLHLIGEMK